MAIPAGLESARLFVGILAAGRDELVLAVEAAAREFGEPHLGSLAIPFTGTNYYADELGPAPLRAFLAFPGDFPTDRLAPAKLATNRLERELAAAVGGKWPRPVNLDPGYLTPAKLVLASAKNFSHRVYLSNGIYAEVTLQYRHGKFQAFPWTFPDYASGAYDAFFLAVRKELRKDTAHGTKS